ncbi:PepSY domain-containing protein [Bacillus sp. FJAT-27245]|uniref:PepSY domain-containing protein n=1 Tax=Bacillus sp. FJAT-27245 TaxID=1684144 RepID=UPI0006A7DE15|nr:PepSY domain-containing protein [Bacillus sp. FJAT-27245]
MKLFTKLLTNVLLIGSLGMFAYATIDNQSVSAQANVPASKINQLKAIDIASHLTRGGLVTDSHLTQEGGLKKYEITITKQDRDYQVKIDALTGKVIGYNEVAQEQSNFEKENSLPNNSVPNVSVEEAK